VDAPQRKSSEEGSEAYPADSIRASYRIIARICLDAGLDNADADDLAQDLWEWLIRKGVPNSAIATPWLKAAVQNYVLRFRRRSYWQRVREGRSLESAPEPQASALLPRLECNELIDRIASLLPKTERNLLALLRRGYSNAEAAQILKIPRGSRSYHYSQIVAYARREAKRRNILPQKNH